MVQQANSAQPMACRRCMEVSFVSSTVRGGCACLSKAALGEGHAVSWGAQHQTRLHVSATAHVFTRPVMLHQCGLGSPTRSGAMQASARLPVAVFPAVSACLCREMLTLPKMGLRSACCCRRTAVP